MEAMVLVFMTIVVILSIYLGYELTYAPDMPDSDEESQAQQEREDWIE